MPWKPLDEDDAFPTLGWHVADQMSEFLAQPDRSEYEPFVPTLEQQEFLNEIYRLDPVTGQRTIHRAVLSRPRGWGKSPFLAAIGIAEAIFEVLFDGWDADGQPVAKPWSAVRTPLVMLTAVTEDQVRNTWDPLLEMLRNGSAVDEFRLEPMDTFVALERGRIEQRTASPRAVKGARAVCALMDQTETWVPQNHGPQLAQTLRNNATKLGGITIESPNAYTLGERSVAEGSAKFWADIQAGKVKSGEDEVRSLYFDHRAAPASTDPTNLASLVDGLRVAYGDSAKHPDGCVLHDPPCRTGWVDLGRVAVDFMDTSNDPAVMRADFLNQLDAARDAYVSEVEIKACLADGYAHEPVEVSKDEPITLGFDGSEGRKEGIADATVLIGYSVKAKYFFPIKIWAQPEGPQHAGWRPPKPEIDATVRQAFKDYNVVGFYADPSAGWAGEVKTWEALFGKRLQAKMSAAEPIRWKQRDVARTCATFEQLYSAIRAEEVTFENHPLLIQHFLNARRDPRRSGYVLKKADDNQDFGKIDATYGAMFAYAAGLDALGAGVKKSSTHRTIRRIR